MWVVVIQPDEHSVPSVVGPFKNSEKAVSFANSIMNFVLGTVKIATLNPIPEEYK